MSCGKYHIMFAKYPFKGFYDGDYGTDHLIPFLAHFFKACLSYEIVDVEFRDFKRMGVTTHGAEEA